MTRLSLLSLALLAACGGCYDFGKIPGQVTATEIVWVQTYGATDAITPPAVDWILQDRLSCDVDSKTGLAYGFRHGSYYGDPENGGDCVGGVAWQWPNVAEVALPLFDAPPYASFSTTSFAHELYHSFLAQMTGDIDPDHAGPGWGIGFGHPRGVLDDANAALAASDL